MAYIANRPVRFDRNYAIGERIPDSVIDPKMTTKLISMGRIIRIHDQDQEQNTPADGAGEPQSGENGAGGTKHQGDEENAPEGKSDGADGTPDSNGDDTAHPEPAVGNDEPQGDTEEKKQYICAECGRAFTSANGLAAHSRSHKK